MKRQPEKPGRKKHLGNCRLYEIGYSLKYWGTTKFNIEKWVKEGLCTEVFLFLFASFRNKKSWILNQKECEASSCLTQFSIMYLHQHNDDMHIFWMKNTCPQAPTSSSSHIMFQSLHDRRWECYESRTYVNMNSETVFKSSTYFSSGGGGISCIGVEIGVFSISIIANGASGSGRGETALSIDAPSPVAGSVAFPALLPNLMPLQKPIHLKIRCVSFIAFHNTREFSVWDFVRKTIIETCEKGKTAF